MNLHLLAKSEDGKRGSWLLRCLKTLALVFLGDNDRAALREVLVSARMIRVIVRVDVIFAIAALILVDRGAN
jgi:hypothetical protein